MLQDDMPLSLPNNILIPEIGRLLDEGHEVILMTKGNSMLPFIIGGRDSVILVKPVPGKLEAGDVVLAEVAPGRFVLHRIVRIRDGVLTLRGDGNISRTEQCGVGDVIGSAVGIVRKSGRTVRIGKAPVWRNSGPVFRRYALALYRRTVYRIAIKKQGI